MKHPSTLLLRTVLVLSWLCCAVECRPRFELIGPVVTLTMKENGDGQLKRSSGSGGGAAVSSSSSTSKKNNKGVASQAAASSAWMKDISSIRPKAFWSLQTVKSPLPNWLPSLKQLKGDFSYEYHRLKKIPSWIETTAKFSTIVGDLYIQPCLDFTQKNSSELRLQLMRGTSYARAHLVLGSRRSNSKTILKSMTGSFFLNLPYSTVRTLRLTPHLDLTQAYPDFSCLIEATTGGAGRTKAVLNLEYNNPTLAVVHQLDERNKVSPEISIYNARITYQWEMKLSPDGKSFIRTKVDPLQAIYITWTDESAQGGSWVTDIRLPLEGATIEALVADVRIKRQFEF
mmetsp:Transcript_7650/g.10012  ORF Transcript_7650/g.10012 Transcript_7650/m.10012 type:complete len:343 (+) Transcript_7650:101-1129(+)